MATKPPVTLDQYLRDNYFLINQNRVLAKAPDKGKNRLIYDIAMLTKDQPDEVLKNIKIPGDGSVKMQALSEEQLKEIFESVQKELAKVAGEEKKLAEDAAKEDEPSTGKDEKKSDQPPLTFVKGKRPAQASELDQASKLKELTHELDKRDATGDDIEVKDDDEIGDDLRAELEEAKGEGEDDTGRLRAAQAAHDAKQPGIRPIPTVEHPACPHDVWKKLCSEEYTETSLESLNQDPKGNIAGISKSYDKSNPDVLALIEGGQTLVTITRSKTGVEFRAPTNTNTAAGLSAVTAMASMAKRMAQLEFEAYFEKFKAEGKSEDEAKKMAEQKAYNFTIKSCARMVDIWNIVQEMRKDPEIVPKLSVEAVRMIGEDLEKIKNKQKSDITSDDHLKLQKIYPDVYKRLGCPPLPPEDKSKDKAQGPDASGGGGAVDGSKPRGGVPRMGSSSDD